MFRNKLNPNTPPLPGDTTYLDIFREFSHMASHNPEKLKRRSIHFRHSFRLCLSITDFHPDTWNPAWSVSTILTGLLSFMLEKGPTLGSIETSEFTKRQLASQSLAFNTRDKVFCELFPDTVDEIKQKLQLQEELSSRSPPLPLPDVVPNSETQNGRPAQNGHVADHQQGNRNNGLLGGALANIFVIVGFAAFAYTVKYVLRSIAQE
ncbi:Ubiquitin-conjugating enzyme E2 J2 [Bagarius yarrelli]|uniref:Ubiquitin-conjugating enzyme E2 J2 n=1 Tax=Bagarius yarrelli TaxID=175774 RepID=A0A556U0A7_BAGYA|nr:Ubiquitin-conjugating enzyme E2 J2 [Bagarius yarrelli]